MLEYNLGILALLSYNLLTAAKGVFLGSFLQKVDPFIVLSLCFALVTLVFTTLNMTKKTPDAVDVLPVLKKHWRLVVGLNISAVLGWGSYFFALKLIEPVIVVSFTQGAGPVITALYYLIVRRENRSSVLEWVTHAITCVILSFLTLISLLGLSAVGSISSKAVFLGTLASITCGIANVVNTILTKSLNNAGLKPQHIIPVRFYLLIITGVICVPGAMWSTLEHSDVIISIFLIAFVGVALPVYLVQVGIQKTNPIAVALTMAALPVFMLSCQFFDHRLVASVYSVLGAFSVALLYMISLVLKFPPQISIRKSVYYEAL